MQNVLQFHRKLQRFLLLSSLTLLGSLNTASALEVLVSFQPYQSVVQNILGEHGKVTVLLPPGASPHMFDPTPQDLKKVTAAGVAIMNGGGIDHWLKTLAQKVRPGLPILEVMPRVKFTPLKADALHGGGNDPHIWLDASIMAKAAVWIGQELGKVDPANKKAYAHNATLEARKLMQLHQELKRDLRSIRNQSVVTFHQAWGYWSRAYGPKVAATVEPFPGKEPTPRYVKGVLEQIRRHQVQVIFGEPTLPEGPARTIAQMAGIRYAVLAPEGDALGLGYEQMMRRNRDVLLKELLPAR
ncbi:metal ABC transporter substrate-binding protein [Deinococcus cellulosilyticus]|uniref:Adhesion protein n=1 Tax=Deinococcus cellulosilyticus (strain DSM 18568 / NBRC 106333 / KACC 11606 / 5516J-15) TaxID=1223518 RepID=A0A511MYM6_DEIC1|nr:metal ABC transporter substrate-binding protein [Deinococcus cellulosilyticus]GEM45247.1 adhesion protein [Deinococcus cellulosilyticus NBRC 106333 = KACC 11606]